VGKKRYRRQKKDRPYNQLLSTRERLIVRLEEAMSRFKDTEDRTIAESLVSQFRRKGGLTPSQWHLASSVSGRPKQSNAKQYYVYAIQAGPHVKIGFSHNPKGRLKEIQTGNPLLAKLIWQEEAGTGLQSAKLAEAKYHKKCKKFRVHGEWFTDNCLSLLSLNQGDSNDPIN